MERDLRIGHLGILNNETASRDATRFLEKSLSKRIQDRLSVLWFKQAKRKMNTLGTTETVKRPKRSRGLGKAHEPEPVVGPV
jgi:hypothetical protein